MAGSKKGRFTPIEDKYLKDNHTTMTDKQMGDALGGRDAKSITNRRTKLELKNPKTKPKITKKHREAYVAQLDDSDRKRFFEKEIIASSRYRTLSKALDVDERQYYVEKYIDFMMDPTIETMTAMEKDTLHQMIQSEIQIQRFMLETKKHADILQTLLDENKIQTPGGIPQFSRSREIKDCQDVIMKCQKSLMVERTQRLKDQSDQSVTFTNLISEMKDPRNRFRLGAEAAMLKVIAEQTFNSKLGKNFMTGSARKFDMSNNFRSGEVPDLPEEFLPTLKEGGE